MAFEDEREEKGQTPGFDLGEQEILASLQEERGSTLFLGRYTLLEVKAFLAKKNFFREARRRQLWPLVFELDSSEYPVQRFQIFWERKSPDNLIVDLKVREGGFPPTPNRRLDPVFSRAQFLHLEWLTLQHPRQEFSEKRPALPGQSRPGLGLGKKVLDIFSYLGKITSKDGLLAFPAYFHNALLFSRYFRFVNPVKEGEVLAIREALASVPFKQLAWIVYLNCLQMDGRVYEWHAEEQAFALSPELKDYFAGKKYKEEVKRVRQSRRVSVDWETFRRFIISASGAVSTQAFAVPD